MTRWYDRARPELVPVAALVVFFLVLFERSLFGGQFLLIGDPLRQLYPLRVTAWDAIRSGMLPLWSPYILGGYPTAAMVMLGITYPVTWGYLLLEGHWAEQLYILTPYFLSPIFTYAFLRELGRGRIASLLGGLTFAYGGFLFSPIGLTGVHANSALWLPLHLFAIASARRGSLLPSLFLATFAYAMSILAGSGQMFLYAGALAVSYAVYLALVPEDARKRWAPFAVALGSIVLAAGLCAYQIFETWIATGLSVRRAYPMERVAEGSFAPGLAWRSMLQPMGNFWDSATYVPLLAVVLAAIAIVRVRKSPQIVFWLVVAVAAWLLILGQHTPLFPFYAKLPFVGRFRYPSRHSLEWTFAIGVLAAYGWDLVESSIRRSPRTRLQIALGSVFVAVAAVIAWLWGGDILQRKVDVVYDINNAIRGLDTKYVLWKIALAISAAVALWFFARTTDGSLRTALMAIPLLLVCFVEPYFWIMRPIAHPWSQPASYFETRAETTRLVQRESGPHERTFSLAHPYVVPAVPVRDIDAPNWTALGGLEDVNGYESLIFERHSSALRSNPGADAEPFLMPNAGLLGLENHVLDVLNVRFVLSYDDFQSAPAGRVEKEGIHFYGGDLGIDLPPARAMTLSAPAREADTLVVVTHMAFSGNIAHGEPVARVTVQQPGGKSGVVFIRAGVDTAEWAHERADVKPVIRHGLAPVYDSASGDAAQSFQSHRFIGRIALGERMPVERIEIVNISKEASIGVWKASLVDSATKESWPLPEPSPSRWQAIHQKNGVTVLKNLRARPRAWLVTKVEVASKADVLATIRGAKNHSFDPAATALIEEKPERTLTGEPCGQPCSVEIVRHEPNRIAMRTNSRAPAMLVVSEIYYPGWIATVDGVETPIHQTDYLIRGVVVPAGRHDVVMSFRPRGTIRGGIVSLCTLLLLAGGSIALRRAQ